VLREQSQSMVAQKFSFMDEVSPYTGRQNNPKVGTDKPKLKVTEHYKHKHRIFMSYAQR